MYSKFVKRSFDFIIAVFGLILISPIFLFLIVFLYFSNKGAGVFFTQSRPGKNETIFKVIKFKTMTDEKDPNGLPLPDDLRLTKIGKFVRSTSLDEIPQLINVVKGDMSLIGPRPLLVKYLPLYNDSQRCRHNVRPGITGWAQVNGRNAISWQQKFELDVWYVENLTLWLDIKILILTIKKVIVREGINSSTAATIYEFNGKN